MLRMCATDEGKLKQEDVMYHVSMFNATANSFGLIKFSVVHWRPYRSFLDAQKFP